MSNVATPDTFLDAVLRGDALAADAEDWIERWHDLPGSNESAALELHEYLGLTWDEYQLYVARPESLRFVVRARLTGDPVEVVADQARSLSAAARSQDSSDAAGVLEWLEKHGRLKPSAD